MDSVMEGVVFMLSVRMRLVGPSGGRGSGGTTTPCSTLRGRWEGARGGVVGRDLVRDAGSVRSGGHDGLTVLVGALELALGGDQVAQGAQVGPNELRELADGLEDGQQGDRQRGQYRGDERPGCPGVTPPR